MTRWRNYTDRLIVLAVILAAWQVGSVLVGPYWLSSPAAVAARFTAQILNGELIVQGGYTVEGRCSAPSSAGCRRCCCRSCCGAIP